MELSSNPLMPGSKFVWVCDGEARLAWASDTFLDLLEWPRSIKDFFDR